jgi:hypothetical protein
VDDARRVGVRESRRDLLADLSDSRPGQPALLGDLAAERVARDELHDDPRAPSCSTTSYIEITLGCSSRAVARASRIARAINSE